MARRVKYRDVNPPAHIKETFTNIEDAGNRCVESEVYRRSGTQVQFDKALNKQLRMARRKEQLKAAGVGFFRRHIFIRRAQKAKPAEKDDAGCIQSEKDEVARKGKKAENI